MTSLLKIRGLHAAYGKIEALKGVDIDISPGEASRAPAPDKSCSTVAISPISRRMRLPGCALRSRLKGGGFSRA